MSFTTLQFGITLKRHVARAGSDAHYNYYVKSRITEWIITIHFPLSVDIFSCVIMKGDLPQTEMGCWLDLWQDFPDRNSFFHL